MKLNLLSSAINKCIIYVNNVMNMRIRMGNPFRKKLITKIKCEMRESEMRRREVKREG